MKKLISLFGIFCILSLTSCKNYQQISVSKIESARIIEMNTKGVEVELTLKVKNPNSFGFTVTGTDMIASVNGITLGNVDLEDKVRVKARSEDTHTFRIKSDFSQSLAGGLLSLATILQKKTATVNLKGDLKVRSYFFFRKRYPIDLTERIPLSSGSK